MLAYLRHRHQLSRLEASLSTSSSLVQQKIRKAKDDKFGYEQIATIESGEQFEFTNLEYEKQELVSGHLLSVASRMSLPTPDFDDEDAWQVSSFTGARMLSRKGQWTIRKSDSR